jgi:3-hydroxymyristoyl/3-hydroxydecanoyl-(acyl carrier protein) dehydratase
MADPALPLRLLDDAAFVADLPYDPEALFLDELVEIDREKSLVRCRMATREDLPLTRSQRAHPIYHPRHVAGAVIVHATGMLGFVHAYHVLGLRHRDGWIGYGTHIHRAVFRKLVQPGAPIDAVCRATRTRAGKTRYFVRYSFEFRHEGAVCYEGDQTAVWLRIDGTTPPSLGGSDAG